MAEKEHMTERGALLAALEHKCVEPGVWLVEGWKVQKCRVPGYPTHLGRQARGGYVRGRTCWDVTHPSRCARESTSKATFTEALRWIADRLAR